MQATIVPPPPAPPAQTVTVTPPGFGVYSTWIILVGMFIAAGGLVSFVTALGWSPTTSSAITAFGVTILGFGTFLTQHGY